MVTQKIAVVSCILCFATSLLLAQSVEKLSASFTFPTTLTSINGKSQNPNAVSFFRVGSRSVQKGKIALEWSVGNSAVLGTICIYTVSGVLVKKAIVTANHGTWQCDLGKTGAGIYLASISYGQYRQNLKLALYR
jgi:hypothetical protein